MFAPTFVGCSPPHWLWADENSNSFDEEDESKAEDTPILPRNRAIKKAWEEAVGEDILHHPYTPHSQLARRLFKLAIQGVHSNWDKEAAEKVLEEWEIMWQEFQDFKNDYEAEEAEHLKNSNVHPEAS